MVCVRTERHRAPARRPWESGTIERIELIDPKALRAELESDEGLKQQLDDVNELVGEAMAEVADTLQYAVGEAYAVDVLSLWEGFKRFCREVLALEPLTLLKALRIAQEDPAAKVLESYPDAKADESKAVEWVDAWKGNWDRRFGRQPAEVK
jgi:hypothetical protein